MTRIRRNIYDLGDDWAEPVLWYARAVKAMQTRALDETTSWLFYGGIHGFNRPLWDFHDLIPAGQSEPSQAVEDKFWNQCQHGTWYFLPWHRGYVLALEEILLKEIEALGGPHDTWALPYWNYFKTDQNDLPPAFATPDWPDGQGDNPLFVQARFGPFNDGNVFVPMNGVDLDAMGEPDYTGTATGGNPGFGGTETGFAHGGRPHGKLESQPHDMVHVFVGGGTQSNPGLMSVPATAAVDPIFWLHHANIDRLWEAWVKGPVSTGDPTQANWLDGPAAQGDRSFVMPRPDGSDWVYAPKDMRDILALGYEYDDLTPGADGQPVDDFLAGFGTVEMADALGAGDVPMGGDKRTELVGASDGAIGLSDGGARTSVALDVPAGVEAGMAADDGGGPRERVFLNLENVVGASDAVAFQVYLGLPDGADPSEHPDNRAGSVGLFGVTEASDPDGSHSGSGLNFVLEVTKVMARLQRSNGFGGDGVRVDLVPIGPVGDDAEVRIGRISFYRESR